MTQNKHTKTINAWCWYDWANSSYSLVITSAIFPAYFLGLQQESTAGTWWQQFNYSVLYAYLYSLASLLILFLSPLFGSIADYAGRKKRYMRLFSYVGALSCGALYFATGRQMGLTCTLFIISSTCYSLGVVFYNAYIPEIAAPGEYDAVSAKGFAWGYVGGLVALITCLLIIQNAASIGFTEAAIKNALPVRVSFVLIGLWWWYFARYALRRLPADQLRQPITLQVVRQSYTRIFAAFRHATRHKVIALFLLAFFFYDMGVTTIMGMSGVFAAKTLGLTTEHLIGVILLLQVLAVAGSWLFVQVAKHYSNLTAVQWAVLLWIIICYIGYGVRNSTEFYIMASLVGLVMGGTQALSRSAFATLIQGEQHEYATWFSLYDVLDKIGVVIGTFIFGWVEWITGSMRISVAILSVFFIIGFIFLLSINRPWKK